MVDERVLRTSNRSVKGEGRTGEFFIYINKAEPQIQIVYNIRPSSLDWCLLGFGLLSPSRSCGFVSCFDQVSWSVSTKSFYYWGMKKKWVIYIYLYGSVPIDRYEVNDWTIVRSKKNYTWGLKKNIWNTKLSCSFFQTVYICCFEVTDQLVSEQQVCCLKTYCSYWFETVFLFLLWNIHVLASRNARFLHRSNESLLQSHLFRSNESLL